MNDEQSESSFDDVHNVSQDMGLTHQEKMELHSLCEQSTHQVDSGEAWENIRNWLRKHSTDEAAEAVIQTGRHNTCPLHLICRSSPPIDLVEAFINAGPDTSSWVDTSGCLPLHYACAHGSSEKTLQLLLRNHPEGMIHCDTKGRTPLQLVLTCTQTPPTGSVVSILARNGALTIKDVNGMYPLHYACAYGASEEVLRILANDNRPPNSLDSSNRHRNRDLNGVSSLNVSSSTKDAKGRTALHFAMGNCDRYHSPAVIRFLLEQNPHLVDIVDDNQQLPIFLLANRANDISQDVDTKAARESIKKCLDLYLTIKMKPNTTFLTALKSLPEWLHDRAVVMPLVQESLNERISQRFPTAFMMMDFYAFICIIFTYSFAVLEAIERRTNSLDDAVPILTVIPLYIGAFYFFIREIIQILSYSYLGIFKSWLLDPMNWIDVLFISLAFFWGYIINTGTMNLALFRTGNCLSLFVMWIKFLTLLQNLLVDFAVFMSGVLNVVKGFGPFITASMIILFAFTQMFFTIFYQTSSCRRYSDIDPDTCDPENKASDERFCTKWISFLSVYTMLLGEVDEMDFIESEIATALYIIFMFLVVILLANVLIAIVTDSFGEIKNERAAIVFWSNRLNFVAEMDAMSAGPWRKKVKNALMMPSGLDGDSSDEQSISDNERLDMSSELWKKLVDFFEEDTKAFGIVSIEFWYYFLFRCIAALIIIPLWVVCGFFSAGYLWPPQVRAWLLEQRITKYSEHGGATLDTQQRMKEVKRLRIELDGFRDDILLKAISGKSMIAETKNNVGKIRNDLATEIAKIKEMTNILFEQHNLKNID